MLDDAFIGIILSVFNETLASSSGPDSAAKRDAGAGNDDTEGRIGQRFMQSVSMTAFQSAPAGAGEEPAMWDSSLDSPTRRAI